MIETNKNNISCKLQTIFVGNDDILKDDFGNKINIDKKDMQNPDILANWNSSNHEYIVEYFNNYCIDKFGFVPVNMYRLILEIDELKKFFEYLKKDSTYENVDQRCKDEIKNANINFINNFEEKDIVSDYYYYIQTF